MSLHREVMPARPTPLLLNWKFLSVWVFTATLVICQAASSCAPARSRLDHVLCTVPRSWR